MGEPLVIGQRDILLVAKVKVICDNRLSNSLKDFFAFGLVDGLVQEPMFEGDKLDVSDFMNAIFHESANRFAIGDYAQVRFLENDDNPHNKVELLVEFGRNLFSLFFKCFLLQGFDFRGLSVET